MQAYPDRKDSAMAREQWMVEQPKRIDIETVRQVKVTMHSGSVDILTHGESSAQVEISGLREKPVRVAIEGDTLVIDQNLLRQQDLIASTMTLLGGPSAHISVLVPERSPVSVRVVNADVLVAGSKAAISVTTSGGNISLDGVEGPTQLRTVSGEIAARRQRGTLTARTASGDAIIAGPVDNASVWSATGQIIMDVDGALPDRVSLQSGAGSVTLRLPEDASPNYRIATITGRSEIDGQQLGPLYTRAWTAMSKAPHAEATDVSITTGSGRVLVVRGAASERSGDAGGEQQRQPVNDRDAKTDADIQARVRDAGERMKGEGPVTEPAAAAGVPGQTDPGSARSSTEQQPPNSARPASEQPPLSNDEEATK